MFIIADVIKIFFPAITAFIVGIAITPLWSHFLYTHKMWKKKSGKTTLNGGQATVFNELHKDKEVNTPRLGGVIIWMSVFVTVSFIWILSQIFDLDAFIKLDFLSRSQTWIPLSALLIGAGVGMIDDFLEIKKGTGGLSLRKRLLAVGLIALACGLWFFTKLDVVAMGLPGGNELILGWLIIPLFIVVMIGVYAGGIIDGLDGLAGGLFASMFFAYGGIAFYQSQINLAAFCMCVAGAILAFLWFNIPPARFYMSETGSMALTVALTVIAFMTDNLAGGYGLLVLPVIAAPLFLTIFSVVIQLLSKKYRGKKIFHSTPIHHHFEAIGWPAYKVTMRYWIVGLIFALLGMFLALLV